MKISVKGLIAISLASFLITGCTVKQKPVTKVDKKSTTVANETISNVENKNINNFNYDLDKAQIGKKQRGYASWYGKELHGERVASGETFDMYALTAAHRTLPFNTLVKVTNLQNGKSVVVRINDRGPYNQGRIIDLSYKAALELGITSVGSAEIQLEVLGSSKKGKFSKPPVTTYSERRSTKRKVYKPVVMKSRAVNEDDILDDRTKNQIDEIEKSFVKPKTRTKRRVYKGPSRRGSVMVQIGSYLKKSSALKMKKRAKREHPEYKTIIQKAVVKGRTYYRVKIKGFSSRADAKDFISGSGYVRAYISK